ncbi:MAG: hypothetical protein R2707_20085 [Acidimicrobiales bacterium]
MATTAHVIEFTRDDTSPVIARMQQLESLGSGWINLGPGLTPEDFSTLPTQSTVGKWISGRGPAVPMATWTPASPKGRARSANIGIAHGTGPNALDRLADAGVALPSGWQKRQDHAKNGIVAALPDTVDHAGVVDWALRAMVVLSPRVAIGDEWIAEVFGAD